MIIHCFLIPRLIIYSQSVVATLAELRKKLPNGVNQVVTSTDPWSGKGGAKDKLEHSLQLLEMLALGVEMINHPLNVAAMQNQNKRIRSAL